MRFLAIPQELVRGLEWCGGSFLQDVGRKTEVTPVPLISEISIPPATTRSALKIRCERRFMSHFSTFYISLLALSANSLTLRGNSIL